MSWAAIGNQTITATDVNNPSIVGSQSGIQVVHNVVYKFFVQYDTHTLDCGVQTNICVTALDQCNNVVTNYAGTVQFETTNDTGATLPANYTFLPSDNGHRCFPITHQDAGTTTTKVFDVSACDIYGVDTVTIDCP